jgi:hypothetical protein
MCGLASELKSIHLLSRMTEIVSLSAAVVFCASASYATDDFDIASEWECGNIVTAPKQTVDRDPVYKISVILRANTTKDELVDIEPAHITVSGKRYNRKEQYRRFYVEDVRLTLGGGRWTGQRRANKAYSMQGVFFTDQAKNKTYYREQFFRNGKLQVTITSQCHKTQGE